MAYSDDGRQFEGAILLTQCLQRDFVDLEPPSPNRLHLGQRMVRRLRGLDNGVDRLGQFLRAAYTAPGHDNLTVINIRDWHDQADPAQTDELAFFGPHCLADSPGAEFVTGLKELSAMGDVQPIDSIYINDFVGFLRCSTKQSAHRSLVGERGVKLSGGQRQRIAIARAFLANPAILLLDEATSAVEPESESIIQQALDRLMAGRTSFIVSHRLSVIRPCEMIAVIDAGRVAEKGTHAELLDCGGIYAQMYRMQMGEEAVVGSK